MTRLGGVGGRWGGSDFGAMASFLGLSSIAALMASVTSVML